MKSQDVVVVVVVLENITASSSVGSSISPHS